MARPFAAFDIDGTLIRWQLYHAIGDGLAKQGIIGPQEFDKVRRARMNWKKRAGEDSFVDYEKTLVAVFDRAIKDLDVKIFKQVIGKVFDEYKEQVYIYTRGLIAELKKQNYLLLAVSGSPTMIVDLMARYYEFDDFAGSTYEVIDGKFSGHKDLSIGHKAELVKKLAQKHGASFAKSLAVGDSEGDIDMLKLVEQPIAFNPTKQLFDHARQAGWVVVVERKNMVYKLEASVNGYRLA